MQYSVNQSFHLNPFLINLGEKMICWHLQSNETRAQQVRSRSIVSCHVLPSTELMCLHALKPRVLSYCFYTSWIMIHFFFPLKLYFRIEKTTSRRSPSAFQNVKKFSVLKGSPSPVAFPWWPHFFTVQVSSEADGELFHSWKKQVKYKHTSTCYIKLWEEKSTLGKYQATYFMIFKCHSFVQYWLFYMVVEL